MGFKGYTNYETYLTSLYLEDIKDWKAFTEDELIGDEVEKTEKIYALADELKTYIKFESEELRFCGFYGKLLDSAIDNINFMELATKFLNEK